MRTPRADPVLTVEGASFAFGAHRVLDGVSMEISPGEFTALVGPNGAGKSTLLRIVLGLLAPQAGRVELFGSPPRRLRDPGRLAGPGRRRFLAPRAGPAAGPAGAGRGGRRRRTTCQDGMVATAPPQGPGCRRARSRIGGARRSAAPASHRALGGTTAAGAD